MRTIMKTHLWRWMKLQRRKKRKFRSNSTLKEKKVIPDLLDQFQDRG
jgi:hypothetical protein